MKINRKVLLLTGILSSAFLFTACGKDDELTAQRTIEKLEVEINDLENRVAELEEQLDTITVDDTDVLKKEESSDEETTEETSEEISEETVQEQIDKLIEEKKDIIEQKKTAPSSEQKALGIRIGEIEREISKLRIGN